MNQTVDRHDLVQEEGEGKREVQVQEMEEDEQLRPEGRKKLFTG